MLTVTQKWVKALRSGEYKQGKGHLRNSDNTFCCLGVLCDLYIKETGNGQWVGGMGYYQFLPPEGGLKYALLPEVVQKWAGLDSIDPCVKPPDERPRALSSLNDLGASFKKIADLIEKNYESST
jgi:hypothetical protein